MFTLGIIIPKLIILVSRFLVLALPLICLVTLTNLIRVFASLSVNRDAVFKLCPQNCVILTASGWPVSEKDYTSEDSLLTLPTHTL